MTTFTEIPTRPVVPQTVKATLLGVTYFFQFHWNPASTCWIMDIFESDKTTKVMCGVPLITGADLLEQFQYLPIGALAAMIVVTIGIGESPDEVPSETSLGVDGHLYYVTA